MPIKHWTLVKELGRSFWQETFKPLEFWQHRFSFWSVTGWSHSNSPPIEKKVDKFSKPQFCGFGWIELGCRLPRKNVGTETSLATFYLGRFFVDQPLLPKTRVRNGIREVFRSGKLFNVKLSPNSNLKVRGFESQNLSISLPEIFKWLDSND